MKRKKYKKLEKNETWSVRSKKLLEGNELNTIVGNSKECIVL